MNDNDHIAGIKMLHCSCQEILCSQPLHNLPHMIIMQTVDSCVCIGSTVQHWLVQTALIIPTTDVSVASSVIVSVRPTTSLNHDNLDSEQ